MARPILLAIPGSLRRDSHNRAILESLREALADKADVRVHPLNDVPLYDQDLDTDTPPAGVAAFRAAIGEADGIIIAAAEYNYGISGVLKNALDWASRPYGKAKLTGKMVFTLSSSPAATGGVRAQAQLNETLAAIGARIVLRPQSVIANVTDKISEGRLVDEKALAFLLRGVADLLRDIASPNVADRES